MYRNKGKSGRATRRRAELECDDVQFLAVSMSLSWIGALEIGNELELACIVVDAGTVYR